MAGFLLDTGKILYNIWLQHFYLIFLEYFWKLKISIVCLFSDLNLFSEMFRQE